MKKIAVVALAFYAFGSSSLIAADMPVKALTPPTPVFSWTGFYVGGNVGYGWGTADNTISAAQVDGLGGSLNQANFNAVHSSRANGVIGGLQAGYNWQSSNFLVGLETDIQASDQKASAAFVGGIIPTWAGGPVLSPNPAAGIDNTRLAWLGTTRARIGFASDRWLVYATGGLAYGSIDQGGSLQPANPFPVVANAPIGWANSTTRVGWTAGAGLENAIGSNWSWKVEYLYVDLGNASANVSGGVGNSLGNPANCYGGSSACAFFRIPATGAVTSHFTDNIVRVGLNYRFH